MDFRWIALLTVAFAAGPVFVGCDGCDDRPPSDDATDSVPNDSTVPGDADARDDSSGPDMDSGTNADLDGNNDDVDARPPEDSGPKDSVGGDADGAGSPVDLVHVPPECNVSTQTCSVTLPTDAQSGLKVQVIRNTSGVQGVTVNFEIVSGKSLASLGSTSVTTGPRGRAGVQFTTGSMSGSVRVKAWLPGWREPPIYWDVTIQ